MGRGQSGLPYRRSFRPLGRARFDDRSNVYSGRASRSAQAVATAELGVAVPGGVAQPPSSMIDRRSHDEALLNSVNFAGASACCWNLSTQIGASTSTTAVSARSFAIRSAVPPSVHPKIVKPSTDMAAAPMTTPQIPGFILGGNLIDLMSCAPVSASLGPFPRDQRCWRPGQYVRPRSGDVAEDRKGHGPRAVRFGCAPNVAAFRDPRPTPAQKPAVINLSRPSRNQTG